MMKVQVTSREIIKPASPTPHHLSRFKLTLLDQLQPPAYTPILLFYTSKEGYNIETVEKTQQLKKSLSKTLTRYYPFAGRIKEDSSIVECNDEGIEFSEARVDGQLSEFLEQPYVEVLNQMVPCNYLFPKSGRDVLLAVQVNLFNCGGMAIGVCIFHKVADGIAMATFINGWASQSHGNSDTTGPDIQSSTFFPTEGPEPSFAFVTNENVVTKRFVFDASKIAALRDRPSIDLQVGRPTRVEALSALIWRCIMRTRGEEGSMRASLAAHAMNLRRRMSPPLPDHSFGNIIFFATSVATERECHEDMQCYLERKVRDAIRAVDSNYIKELQKPDGISRALAALSSEVGKYVDCGIDFCYFSSWCRFPFYEVDFGWGEPIWVSSATLPVKNLILLNCTRWGDGIEAWVNMEDVYMAKFEQDQELLSFVSFPSKTG
ncbi:stemmadenine O-acetyltransferase-like [Magnolia sinica]|uniref:stemmadenine O-acetyltransferase-like n=1 Tax=Magnolia sinica TaxID=86752 RepID=UPI002659FE03|nr:stemmadenine O-acetyltransferase-like [Magnolia sinica]